ncbi:MAG TPA: hypothetical protein VF817_01840, partial [Patescibacteria group bacterium]
FFSFLNKKGRFTCLDSQRHFLSMRGGPETPFYLALYCHYSTFSNKNQSSEGNLLLQTCAYWRLLSATARDTSIFSAEKMRTPTSI